MKYRVIFNPYNNGYYLKNYELQKIKLLFMAKRKNQKKYEMLNNFLSKIQNVINDFDTIYNILVQFENEREKGKK